MAIRRDKGRQPQREEKALINDGIRYPKVRLIDGEGEQRGIVSSNEARSIAEEAGLDLVVVAESADPPVCRVMNYDKFRYEQKKKIQEAKKNQTITETKEIKFRPKTDDHDLNFKIKNVRKFLAAGNKVKLTMRFRGREIVYCETIGLNAMKSIAESIAEEVQIIQPPKMEGRQLVMVVGPK
ncbi:translation initiation factor IF-3 [Desulforhopalus vacuolatus]|uniref:translation initiation factor IF-3 n=1 Tax=Desulforhopalus vacuolatus TaxID=40414 RepID=UPI0019648673|nr:translation initiation factor IF-3 [Desulforhopalus vacuolatus]MBM9519839.1 translation initiation factor IF-3 [Desulforhopalus vacuolatus]